MTEFFKYITSDFWVFIGTCIIFGVFGDFVIKLIKTLKKKKCDNTFEPKD